MIKVNGEELDAGLIERERAMMLENSQRLPPTRELLEIIEHIDEYARENAVERLLMLQEARRKYPAVPEGVIKELFDDWLKQNRVEKGDKALRQYDDQSIRDRLCDEWRFITMMEELDESAPIPTQEECLRHYEDNRDDFMTPEMVYAAHILRRNHPEEPSALRIAHLLNLRERLLGGADFSETALQFSHCEDEGCKFSWIKRGEMTPSFEDAVFELEAGEISDVFQTEIGYHIAMVKDRRPPELQPFRDVKHEIENTLLETRRTKLMVELIEQLRQNAVIEVIEDSDIQAEDEDI